MVIPSLNPLMSKFISFGGSEHLGPPDWLIAGPSRIFPDRRNVHSGRSMR
jgi:hypothetical protein